METPFRIHARHSTRQQIHWLLRKITEIWRRLMRKTEELFRIHCRIMRDAKPGHSLQSTSPHPITMLLIEYEYLKFFIEAKYSLCISAAITINGSEPGQNGNSLEISNTSLLTKEGMYTSNRAYVVHSKGWKVRSYMILHR